MQLLHTAHCAIFNNFYNNVRIGSHFLYFYWYLKKDVIRVKYGTYTQTAI